MVSLPQVLSLLTVVASVSAQPLAQAESPRTSPLFYDPYLFSGLLHQIFRLTNDITRYGSHYAASGLSHVTGGAPGTHIVTNDIGNPVAIFSNYIGNGLGSSAVAVGSSGLRNTPPRVSTFASGTGSSATASGFGGNPPQRVTSFASGIGSSDAGSNPSIRFKPNRVSAIGAASSSPSGTRFVSAGTNQGTRFAFASASSSSTSN